MEDRVTLSIERCLKLIGKRVFFQNDNIYGTYLNRGIVICPDPFQIDALVCVVEIPEVILTTGGISIDISGYFEEFENLTRVVRLSDVHRTEDLSIAELLTHENENVRKLGLERMAPQTNK
jgi:hypothetical protein